MAHAAEQVFFLAVVSLLLVAGIGSAPVGGSGGAEDDPDIGLGSTAATADGDVNQSLRQMGRSAQSSELATLLEGQQLNVRISRANGTVVTRGLVLEAGRAVRVRQRPFTSPAFSISLSEPTLDSIATSPDSALALEKAIKYDLVSIRAAGATNRIVTGLAVQGSRFRGRSRITAARIDLDADPETDAILEIEGIRSDPDEEFDRLVRTVLRDLDDDGVMDTVTSETRPVASTVTGGVELDLNDDGHRDTLLRLTGQDTNGDAQLDQRTKVTLVDTRGDPQFDSFSETTAPIAPATAVTGEWDLNDDGKVSARLTIQGKDTDGDGSFDRKILTVALNLDGQPGFESTSSTEARINPTLSISAAFDTDGDGMPDTQATLSTSDTNGDGGLDSREVSVVNDSDGDGVYDRVVQRDEFRRGFISNTGEPIRFLNDPQTLTVIGVLASILSMLLQLVQGG